MTNSWEGFLDIIELDPNIRLKANLQILMDFPNGHPIESLLLSLLEKIKELGRRDAQCFGGMMGGVFIQRLLVRTI